MKVENTPNPRMAYVVNDNDNEVAVFNAETNRLLFVTDETVNLKEVKDALSKHFGTEINPKVN